MSENVSMTPYKAAKMVNAALNAAGLNKEIPPQMMYNYTTGRINKGKAPLIKTRKVAGQILILSDALAEWTEQYVAAQVDKATQAAETEDAEDSSEVETDETVEA